MVNSGLCERLTSPFRKTLQIWKIGPEPSASSRFIAYSGLVWRYRVRGRPRSVSGTKGTSNARMCGSIPGAGTRSGVSTSWYPSEARWSRTARWSTCRARAAAHCAGLGIAAADGTVRPFMRPRLSLALPALLLAACAGQPVAPPSPAETAAPSQERKQLAPTVADLSTKAEALLRAQDELVWKHW